MPETCRDIYDNKSQLLYQVGTSRHFREFLLYTTAVHSFDDLWITSTVTTVIYELRLRTNGCRGCGGVGAVCATGHNVVIVVL